MRKTELQAEPTGPLSGIGTNRLVQQRLGQPANDNLPREVRIVRAWLDLQSAQARFRARRASADS